MWNRAWTLKEIEAQFGTDFLAHVRARPNPVAFCECRAAGAWDANDAESYGQFKSLAQILRAGG